jgi:hypothetical protein
MKVNKPITDKDTRPFTDARCGYSSYRIRFYESGYVPNYEGIERIEFATDTCGGELIFFNAGYLTEEKILEIDEMLGLNLAKEE